VGAVLEPYFTQSREPQISLVDERRGTQAGMTLLIQLADCDRMDVAVQVGQELIERIAVAVRPALQQALQHHVCRCRFDHPGPFI
jgi:hypothetical protein